MTVDEFTELQRRVRPDIHIASTRDLDEWVDAVLAGEPRGAYTTMPPAHLLTDSADKRALCGSTDYPRVLATHYPAHARSGLTACPDCLTTARQPHQLSLLDEATT